jgi:hypothetical protein
VIRFHGLGTPRKYCVVLCLSAAGVISTSACNGQSSAGIPTTRTGILLARDNSNEWALESGRELFFVRGKARELAKVERRRVAITGTVTVGRQLTAESISPSELPDDEIRALVEQLRSDRWSSPHNVRRPSDWQFNFTEPMLLLLQVGPAAQKILMQYLGDEPIKDHVIILLGGVGDERAVEPIIHAMAEKENPDQKRLNLIANLALTNITVSDVIWHHGGGIMVAKCPDDPKSCWAAWWLKNKNTFKVAETPSRNYSNYPNYGIYRQP